MDRFQNFGVGTDGVTSMSETLELAKAAEALGYHSFWLSEGYHSRSAIVRATLIAAATSKIKIGLGILSPHTKHPALLAMEAASLDEVARDRVILGIGRVLNALRKHAIDSKGTIQVVKESIDIIRGFFSGEQVQYDGRPIQNRFAREPARSRSLRQGAGVCRCDRSRDASACRRVRRRHPV